MTTLSTIRIGTAENVPAVLRLIHEQPASATFCTPSGTCDLFVLDSPDGAGLAAVAHVTFDAAHAQLDLLAIAPRLVREHVEGRMLSVAEELCVAFGCDHLEATVARHAT